MKDNSAWTGSDFSAWIAEYKAAANLQFDVQVAKVMRLTPQAFYKIKKDGCKFTTAQGCLRLLERAKFKKKLLKVKK